MTENEAIREVRFNMSTIGLSDKAAKRVVEARNMAIKALETIKKLSDRKMTTEVLENYMQFEDECVKKGFTFKSVIEAREKQIPKKPIMKQYFKDMEEGSTCIDKVVKQLEDERELSYADFDKYVEEVSPCLDAEYDDSFQRGLERAIKIVKAGKING